MECFYHEIAALGIPFLALAFISARLARNVANSQQQESPESAPSS